MTLHFHSTSLSHCFSELPHSSSSSISSTCVSTFFFFCTPIPFDAVPTIAAGLASTSIRRHWHGPEALFYLPGIQHTEPLCWRRNVRLCRATSAGLTVMKPACTASAELEMSQLRMVFLLQRHATASLSRCTGVKYYYSFMARRWSRIAQ